VGLLLIAASLSIIGPGQIVGVDNEWVFILIGLSIIGGAGGLVVIPIMPELLEAIEQD